MLSVILPAYNEEKVVERAYKVIGSILDDAHIAFELIFVDDGSTDSTWSVIKEIGKADDRVRGIRFSRNFGKEPAMFAGLEASKGDAVAVMDTDLQHPADKLPTMYKLWEEGYEVVEGVKLDRGKETAAYSFLSKSFYKVMSNATGFNMKDASDFKLLDRKVVDTLNSLPERNVFFRALSYWSGYKKTEVSYVVGDRVTGESKWSVRKLVKYAVTNVLAFTSAPMHIVTVLGMITFAISIIISIYTLIQKIIGNSVEGFTTVILLLLFIGSIIMISIGIIGLYISKIYDEVKGRPKYIVAERIGDKE